MTIHANQRRILARLREIETRISRYGRMVYELDGRDVRPSVVGLMASGIVVQDRVGKLHIAGQDQPPSARPMLR